MINAAFQDAEQISDPNFYPISRAAKTWNAADAESRDLPLQRFKNAVQSSLREGGRGGYKIPSGSPETDASRHPEK